jgi:hypothetical protein
MDHKRKWPGTVIASCSLYIKEAFPSPKRKKIDKKSNRQWTEIEIKRNTL